MIQTINASDLLTIYFTTTLLTVVSQLDWGPNYSVTSVAVGSILSRTPQSLAKLAKKAYQSGFVGGDCPFLVTGGDYRKRHRPTPHYAWLWTLLQAVNRTSGRSGSASVDDPAELGCSRSRTTLGSTPTTPGGSHVTESLGGCYDPWPVKRSTDWLTVAVELRGSAGKRPSDVNVELVPGVLLTAVSKVKTQPSAEINTVYSIWYTMWRHPWRRFTEKRSSYFERFRFPASAPFRFTNKRATDQLVKNWHRTTQGDGHVEFRHNCMVGVRNRRRLWLLSENYAVCIVSFFYFCYHSWWIKMFIQQET